MSKILDKWQAVVEIMFAFGLVFALIQAGFAKEVAIITPIVTGIFGYMKGVSDGKTAAQPGDTPPNSTAP